MICIRLVDAKQFHFTARVRNIGISGYLKTCDDGVTIFIGVVDKEPAILRILRMKGQAQQTLLIPIAPDAVADIQERLGLQLSILEDANTSHFFDHEQAAGAVRLQVHRALEAGNHRLPVIRAGIGEGCC